MSSEGYAASVPLNAAGGAASVPVQGVEEYAADMPEEEYGADTVPAASMPMAEKLPVEKERTARPVGTFPRAGEHCSRARDGGERGDCDRLLNADTDRSDNGGQRKAR